MTKDYDLIALAKTFDAHFAIRRYVPDYVESYLFAFIAHFFKQHRKKQIVAFEKAEQFLYSGMFDFTWQCENFPLRLNDSDLLQIFTFYIRIIKFLSENESEKIRSCYFKSLEERTAYFEKFDEDKKSTGIYFNISLIEIYDKELNDVVYTATFSFTDENNVETPCKNPVLYREIFNEGKFLMFELLNEPKNEDNENGEKKENDRVTSGQVQAPPIPEMVLIKEDYHPIKFIIEEVKSIYKKRRLL